MERTLGPDNARNDPAGYSIDGLRPEVVVSPRGIRELAQTMSAAWEDGLAVAPWGGRTRINVGNRIKRLDAIVDLSRMDRVVEHNPADLTATLEAGMTLATVQRTLGEYGQFLALDPPLPQRATIGGTLATAVTGPLKWRFGSPRDLVIGMKVVQPDGKTTKSGGQVVKNVSGYDMARLHIGGLGTLGIIAEISLRLTPLPPDQKTVLAAFDTGRGCLAAGLSVFHSDVVPLALTSFDSHASERAKLTNLAGGHFLAVRLGGRPRTLERQADDCHSICRESGAVTAETLGKAEADALWRGIADFGWDEATAPKVAGRASLLPTKAIEFAGAAEQRDRVSGLRLAVIVHPATGSVHMSWFDDEDAVPDEAAGDMLDRARHAAHDAGGRFVIERCPIEVKARFDVWDEIGESLATMRRMKEQFDPKGMLNPGRYAGRI